MKIFIAIIPITFFAVYVLKRSITIRKNCSDVKKINVKHEHIKREDEWEVVL